MQRRLSGKVVGPLTIELALKTPIVIGITPIRESQLPRKLPGTGGRRKGLTRRLIDALQECLWGQPAALVWS